MLTCLNFKGENERTKMKQQWMTDDDSKKVFSQSKCQILREFDGVQSSHPIPRWVRRVRCDRKNIYARRLWVSYYDDDEWKNLQIKIQRFLRDYVCQSPLIQSCSNAGDRICYFYWLAVAGDCALYSFLVRPTEFEPHARGLVTFCYFWCDLFPILLKRIKS